MQQTKTFFNEEKFFVFHSSHSLFYKPFYKYYHFMKDLNFTEKESLELISQMIQQSKKNLEIGDGNILLYYGYTAIILAITVYTLVHVTHDAVWSSIWFLMFLPFILISVANNRSKPQVTTHIDKAINSTWSILGWLFLLSVVIIAIFGLVVGTFYFSLMLPLSLLYAGIGISITGVIINFKLMIYTPLVAFIAAIYMLISLIPGSFISNWWNLLFGASFLIMMIIPGHLLNHKAKESC